MSESTTERPTVILSGFGDEAANQKTAEQQFAAFAAHSVCSITRSVYRCGQRHQEH